MLCFCVLSVIHLSVPKKQDRISGMEKIQVSTVSSLLALRIVIKCLFVKLIIWNSECISLR